MPALDYDYDYYEYRNGRRVSANTSAARAMSTAAYARTSAARSTGASAARKPATRTTTNRTQATAKKRNVAAKTTSVRRATTATKAPETKRVPKKTNIATTKKPVTKTKSSIDISLESSKKLNNKPQEMSLKKAQVAAKPKTSLTSVLRNIALVSVFFSLFFMICYRYSVINEKFNSIKKMKNELAEIQAVNGQVQADIESKTDLTYVENYAKYQLGMQKPTSSQTQYVSVEKKDKITTPVVMEDENEMNWFEKIINEIRKIID